MMADGMLDDLIGYLRCPYCGEDLVAASGSLRCARGHSHDIAQRGYVSLFPPRGRTHPGDSPGMVAAREIFLAAGHYVALSDAVTDAAVGTIRPGSGEPRCVVDLGAGTGYYLARLLDRLPGWKGLALDASRPSLRRAARAHERIGAVGCDTWGPLPVRSNAADLAFSVFAPRNAEETSRVLAPDGAFLVATPKPSHLEPLVSELGMLTVGEDKEERLAGRLSPFFVPEHGRDVEFDLALSRAEARALVAMGPSAHHVGDADLQKRLQQIPEPVEVRASVRVLTERLHRAAFSND